MLLQFLGVVQELRFLNGGALRNRNDQFCGNMAV